MKHELGPQFGVAGAVHFRLGRAQPDLFPLIPTPARSYLHPVQGADPHQRAGRLVGLDADPVGITAREHPAGFNLHESGGHRFGGFSLIGTVGDQFRRLAGSPFLPRHRGGQQQTDEQAQGGLRG
jgi:hypothetical protein